MFARLIASVLKKNQYQKVGILLKKYFFTPYHSSFSSPHYHVSLILSNSTLQTMQKLFPFTEDILPTYQFPLVTTTPPLYINLMNRRISKASTNYQFQKFTSDHLFKKQSFNQQSQKIFNFEPPAALDSQSRTLSLFFDNPQSLFGCRRIQHNNQAQRLRQGVYILMRGKIRVLLCKQAKNGSKMEIEHAIYKMENRPKSKCCVGLNKLNIIEVNQPYQVVLSSNNCLAMPDTSSWFIPVEELVELQFYEKLKKVRDLLAESYDIFQVDSQLPFIYKHLVFSFRSIINLSTELQLAVIKKGEIMIQWSKNPLQKLIVSQGSVIIKSKEYNYFCHSSEVELIGIRGNNTYKYIGDPLWTKRPETGTPVRPKEESADKILLFRSRSKNLERLTSNGKSRKFCKKNKSLTRTSDAQNKPSPSKSVIFFSSLQSNKEKWIFMRKIERYQVASNTRSEIEYQRIDAIRQRFKKENVQSSHTKHEALLSKKMAKDKVSFSKMQSKKDTICKGSQLFDSVSNFFKKPLTQHHR